MAKKLKFYSLWFVLINIIIFVIQSMYSGFTDIFVLNELAISSWQVWRFVSSIFLHGSITHLAYNMFALFFFGIALEKFIGSKKFLFVYFFSGIIANIISINFYPSSLGASGAIMGIIGALTIIKPMMMVWSFGMILPMFVAAGLWIAGDVLGAFGAFGDTGIGNIAHLSGVGIGLILGLLLRKGLRKKRISLSKDNEVSKLEISGHRIVGWEDRNLR